MKDFFRFLYVVAIVLSAMFLLWFGLHKYGENRPRGQYQTEVIQGLRSQAPIRVAKNIPLDPTISLPAFSMVKILFSQQWVLNTKGQELELKDLYTRFPGTLFFLEVVLDQTTDLAALKKILDDNENWKRTVIVSRADGILEDLRELSPRWTFTSGEVFLTRFLSLSSIGLASLIDIPGDILYISLAKEMADKEIESLSAEALKQNKLIMIDREDELIIPQTPTP